MKNKIFEIYMHHSLYRNHFSKYIELAKTYHPTRNVKWDVTPHKGNYIVEFYYET